jgi:hypothetical protein
MNDTPGSRWITVVAVLGVVACLSVVALGVLVAGGFWLDPARTVPGVTVTPTPAKSMKGWELYSWQIRGEWHFSLVVGTNRLKTFKEVSSPDVRVQGIEALNTELNRLAENEQVFWLEQRVPGMARPPEGMVEAIQTYCTERGIRLEVDWDWDG